MLQYLALIKSAMQLQFSASEETSEETSYCTFLGVSQIPFGLDFGTSDLGLTTSSAKFL